MKQSNVKQCGFRALTSDELPQVSGGFGDVPDPDEIVVIGTKLPDPWITSIYPDSLLAVGSSLAAEFDAAASIGQGGGYGDSTVTTTTSHNFDEPEPGEDTDGDGVEDSQDADPNDPNVQDEIVVNGIRQDQADRNEVKVERHFTAL